MSTMLTQYEGSVCSSVCQHPQCWRASLQRARKAVKARNGIHEKSHERSQRDALSERNRASLPEKRKDRADSEDGSLPTLKVVDMMGGVGLPAQSPRTVASPSPTLTHTVRTHQRSGSSPLTSHEPGVDSGFQGNLPSPVTPGSEYRRELSRVRAFSSAGTARPKDSAQKVTKIGFHEMYDEAEVNQEWQEIFLTSSYLVWCPAKKKKRKASSKSMPEENTTKTHFKDVTEEMVPRSFQPFRMELSRKSIPPTGGQPYRGGKSPTFSIAHTMDTTEYIRPKTGGSSPGRLNKREKVPPIKSKDDFEMLLGNKKIQLLDAKEKTAPLTSYEIHGGNTKFHLDVDVPQPSLRIPKMRTNKQVAEHMNHLDTAEELQLSKQAKDIYRQYLTNSLPLKSTSKELLTPDEKNKTDLSRVCLSLASIDVPLDTIPESNIHHCTNSIPKNKPLEVLFQPMQARPATATGSQVSSVPAQETSGRYSSLDVNYDNVLDQIEDNELALWTVMSLNSPDPMKTPAPTPVTPMHTAGESELLRQASKKSLKALANEPISEQEEKTSEHWGQPAGEDGKTGKEERRKSIKKSESPRSIQRVQSAQDEDVVRIPSGQMERDDTALLKPQPPTPPASLSGHSQEWPDDVAELSTISGAIKKSISPSSRTNIPIDILRDIGGETIYYSGQKATPGGKQVYASKPRSLSENLPGDYPSSLGLTRGRFSVPVSRPSPARVPAGSPARSPPKNTRALSQEEMPVGLTVRHLSKERPFHSVPSTPMSPPLMSSRILYLNAPRIPTAPATTPVSEGTDSEYGGSGQQNLPSPPPSPSVSSKVGEEAFEEAKAQIEEREKIEQETIEKEMKSALCQEPLQTSQDDDTLRDEESTVKDVKDREETGEGVTEQVPENDAESVHHGELPPSVDQSRDKTEEKADITEDSNAEEESTLAGTKPAEVAEDSCPDKRPSAEEAEVKEVDKTDSSERSEDKSLTTELDQPASVEEQQPAREKQPDDQKGRPDHEKEEPVLEKEKPVLEKENPNDEKRSENLTEQTQTADSEKQQAKEEESHSPQEQEVKHSGQLEQEDKTKDDGITRSDTSAQDDQKDVGTSEENEQKTEEVELESSSETFLGKSKPPGSPVLDDLTEGLNMTLNLNIQQDLMAAMAELDFTDDEENDEEEVVRVLEGPETVHSTPDVTQPRPDRGVQEVPSADLDKTEVDIEAVEIQTELTTGSELASTAEQGEVLDLEQALEALVGQALNEEGLGDDVLEPQASEERDSLDLEEQGVSEDKPEDEVSGADTEEKPSTEDEQNLIDDDQNNEQISQEKLNITEETVNPTEEKTITDENTDHDDNNDVTNDVVHGDDTKVTVDDDSISNDDVTAQLGDSDHITGPEDSANRNEDVVLDDVNPIVVDDDVTIPSENAGHSVENEEESNRLDSEA